MDPNASPPQTTGIPPVTPPPPDVAPQHQPGDQAPFHPTGSSGQSGLFGMQQPTVQSQQPASTAPSYLIDGAALRPASAAATVYEPPHRSRTVLWVVIVLLGLALLIVGLWQFLDSQKQQDALESIRSGQANLLTVEDGTELANEIDELTSQLTALQNAGEVEAVQGPQGEQGEQGTAGQTGAPGAQGEKGDSGEATCSYGICLSLQTDEETVQELGNINISGEVKSGTLAVTTAASIGGTLTVSDAALFNGTLTVASGATFGGNVAVAGTLSAESISLVCPTGYIVVPGNSKFGTSDFCVMKYQAKNVAGVATSVASGTPWVNINQRAAQDASRTAGGHLMTEAEWMTLATDILWQPENWCNLNGTSCGNAPGTSGKYLAAGHNDNSPAQALEASSDDSQACFGTVTAGVNTECGSVSGTQKRTFTLSNGEVIWDVAGNVWEWTDAWITGNEQPTTADSYVDTADHFQWREWTSVNKRIGYLQYAIPTNRGWNSSQRIGQLYSLDDSGYSSTNYNQYAFQRGGGWPHGTTAGVFALYLSFTPTGSSSHIGFRVAR